MCHILKTELSLFRMKSGFSVCQMVVFSLDLLSRLLWKRWTVDPTINMLPTLTPHPWMLPPTPPRCHPPWLSPPPWVSPPPNPTVLLGLCGQISIFFFRLLYFVCLDFKCDPHLTKQDASQPLYTPLPPLAYQPMLPCHSPIDVPPRGCCVCQPLPAAGQSFSEWLGQHRVLENLLIEPEGEIVILGWHAYVWQLWRVGGGDIHWGDI